MIWKWLSRKKELRVLLLLASSFAMLGNSALPADLLVPAGAIWNYLDNGNDPGTAWQTNGFDDTAWLYGATPLGYGDGDEITVVRSNRVNGTRIITTYFRHSFPVEDASVCTNLWLRLLRDDGAVVYLNGVEIYRSNMPTNNSITSSTPALANVFGPDETSNFYQQLLTPAALQNGANILAVEIHQFTNTDTDISFDLALWANYTNAPPIVILTSPGNNLMAKPGTNLTLSANAVDPDSALAKVEFFEGSNKLGERTNAPFSMIWSNVPLGVYSFLAVATDVLGASARSIPATVNVVTNFPPTIFFLSPSNTASFKLGNNITISVLSSDRDGTTAKMEFFEGVNKLYERTTPPFMLVWSNVPLGDYAIRAVATDNVGGTTTSAAINVSVLTNFLPAVTLTTPTNNSLLGGPGNLSLRASALDSDGTINRVEFYAEGVRLGESPSTNSPYGFLWSNTPSSGSFSLTAVATDNAGGAKTSAPVAIIIQSNRPPVVNLTSPIADSLLKLTNLTMSAAALDFDGAIAKVEFYQEATLLGEAANAPYTLTWSNVPPGAYRFRAAATDNAGAVSLSAAIPVRIVTNLPPTIAISSPANNSDLGGPLNVPILLAVTDSDGSVAQVDFYAGVNSLGTVTAAPFSLTWSNVEIGSYLLTAVATDDTGNMATSAPIALSIHTNALPQVALTNPPNNALCKAGTNLTLTATASDSDGAIRRVEFFEGESKLGEDTNAPFSLVWSNIAVGNYTFTAVATDSSGVAVTSAIVAIKVMTNFLPVVSFTRPTNNAVFGGPLDLNMTINATDADGAIRLVEIFANEMKLGELSTNPFAITWSNAPWGNYTLIALATDNVGDVTTSAPVNIVIRSNIIPTISLSSPPANKTFHVSSNITITASASDPDGGLRKVEFFADATKLGEMAASPYSVTWSNLVPGIYFLRATATDFAGACKTSAPVKITIVTNLMPQVVIVSPKNHALLNFPSNVVLQINATDADGTITKVEVFQGSDQVAEFVAAPYSLALSNMLPGTYTFRARATDNNGDTTLSAPGSFTIRNFSTLVATGSVWKYLDDGSDQRTAWCLPNFDDREWASGRAQLGYGDGDEATAVRSNRLDGTRIITTYFRHSFSVEDASLYPALLVRLLRDDGGVVYLNGTEIFRSNMPTNPPMTYTNLATATADNADELSNFYEKQVDGSLLVSGNNVLAVEIHQASATSGDISFDLQLAGFDKLAVTRGPYLQLGTPTNVLVRWRTAGLTDSRVLFGANLASLDQLAEDAALTNEHILQLTGLIPATTYYYSIGTRTELLAGGVDCVFTTAPLVGSSGPTRLWITGDPGAVNYAPWNVQDAYLAYTGLRPAAAWVTLGDNVHYDGADDDFQRGFFDMAAGLLKQLVVWTTPGNHDLNNITNKLPPDMPYLMNFSPPIDAEAGGVPSSNKLYYSFDFANVHFVSLDSQYSDRTPEGPMLRWLEQDLSSTRQSWLIAICHHSPYGKIGNDSDTDLRMGQVRTNFLPIFEAHGVDLVFSGHDHALERSFFLDSFYGPSTNLTGTNILSSGSGKIEEDGLYFKSARRLPHQGTVYMIAGTAARLDKTPDSYHPAMFTNRIILGSVILDVTATNLDIAFLSTNGVIEDHFTIIKTNSNSPPLAQDSSITTLEDTFVYLSLDASDPDGDALTCEILSLPANGFLGYVGSDGVSMPATIGLQVEVASNLWYAPYWNFFGEDQFSFLAGDREDVSVPATVHITIVPVNDAPVAHPRSIIVDEDTAATILLGGYDPDGDSFSYAVAPPAHGALTGEAPLFVYKPDANFFGEDSFTFTVQDESLCSLPATILLLVRSVNDPPVADASATPRRVISPNNLSAVVVLDGSRSYDLEGDPLQFLWRNAAGEPLATGLVAVVRLPVGPQVLSLQVNDGQANTTTQITIEIITANRAVQAVSERLETASLPPQIKKPLTVFLREALDAFDKDHFLQGLNKLENFQKKLQSKLSPIDPLLANQLSAAVQEIIDTLFSPSNSAPGFISLHLKSKDQWQLNFSGTPRQQYVIQASTNLVHWIQIGQGHENQDGAFEFEGKRLEHSAGTFFRATWVQKAIRATDAKEVGVGEPR